MSEHYILFSIGPVQSAIAQARRTQDLWAGSQILSQLAREGLQFASANGASIIYPAVDLTDEQLSIPNRFLISADVSDPKAFAEAIEIAIRGRWQRMGDDIAAGLTKQLARAGLRFNREDLWDPQIKGYLEVYYVLTPATRNYREDSRVINALMNTRKQLRDFEQSAERGHKCTITGEHEALHDQRPGEISIGALRAYWEKVHQAQPNKALFNRGERLCAPSLVKRLVHDYDPNMKISRFPSTSSIASAPFRAGIVANWSAIRQEVDTYLRSLVSVFQTVGASEADLYFARPELFPYIETIVRNNRLSNDRLLMQFLSIDGDWLYQEALTVHEIEVYTGEKVPRENRDAVLQALQSAKTNLSKLSKEVKSLSKQSTGGGVIDVNLAQPSDYYAVLAMDGDDMGKRTRDFRDAREHQAFSAALAEFARTRIKQIVELETPGRVVYAGGDDVLALVPLPYLFHVMRRIEFEFSQLRGIGTTISAGAAIVHRTNPLQEAVQAAKAAEHDAKAIRGKASFALQFLRRSGEPKTGKARWYIDGEPVLGVLTEVAQAMAANQLSRNLPVDMVQLNYAMVPMLEPEERNHWRLNMPAEARDAEFKRLFERRCEQGYRKSPAAWILMDRLQKIANAPGTDGLGWLDVNDLLQVAKFLSQQGGVYVMAAH